MMSREYWAKRSEQISIAQHKRTDAYSVIMAAEYEKALSSMERDLESWWARFAANNEIDLAEARKLMTAGELKEFKWTIKEFMTAAKNNGDGSWSKMLENVYIRSRMSRLDALMIQMQHHIEMVTESERVGLESILTTSYPDSYYQTMFAVHQGIGVGVTFAKLDTKAITEAVNRPWLKENFSSRVWSDRDKLVLEARTQITQGIVRGDGLRDIEGALAKRMKVGKDTAERLVRTEAAHILEEAAFKAYKDSGVIDKYQILATLDSKTSATCRGMDGKIFTLAEKETGVTYPPLHARCRTTTVAYFDDYDPETERRSARNEDGKAITVPGSMTYSEWKQKFGV